MKKKLVLLEISYLNSSILHFSFKIIYIFILNSKINKIANLTKLTYKTLKIKINKDNYNNNHKYGKS